MNATSNNLSGTSPSAPMNGASNAVVRAAAPTLSAAAMETLAHRFRPGGLFVAMFSLDGSISFHDGIASKFFLKYALPQFSSNADLRSCLKSVESNSPIAMVDSIPGVICAVLPYVEARQLTGVLAIAARCESFEMSEELLRACSTLSLDAGWLEQQARLLPGYGRNAIAMQAELMQSTARDQMRLSSMEGELVVLSSQLSNTYEELSLIYQLSSGMKVDRQAGDFFKQACLNVMDVMSVRGMGFALHDEHFAAYRPAVYGEVNLTADEVDRLARDLMVILDDLRQPLLIHHLDQDPRFDWLSPRATQLIAVPLIRQDKTLGCLFGFDKTGGEFDSVDSKLLNSIANESAIYLENSMLFDDAHGLMMGLLHSLTSAVDAKDAYTCGHSERVALISRELARVAGYPETLVERVYMAGLLHDVGKIGVPEAVLRKTGKLDDAEFEQIKKHPEIGARILSDIKQVEDIIPGVMHHHERYDGRGYPHNIAGEAIPLFGRIICLADCFDAMTSSRTYRKALPLETAMSEIGKCAGTQFDPHLAKCFLQIGESRLRELLRDHQEQHAREHGDQPQVEAA